MKIAELLTEGMYIVKSKDGVEKRFKDADSAEAKAWKESTAKKTKVAVYSQKYWEGKDDGERIVPWTKITVDEIADQFDAIASDQGFGRIDDWTKQKNGETKVEGVDVATVGVRMAFSFGKEDDMGLDVEGDERISDSQYIQLRRDVKDPRKLVFAGYK